MQGFVEEFNERARTYDNAWANSAGDEKLQLLYNDLQMSYWDFGDACENILHMSGRLSPPLALSDEPPLTRRERIVDVLKYGIYPRRHRD